MSAASPAQVDLAVDQLGTLGAELGSGGQAVVYDLPELTLPDVPGPLVYKKYKAGSAPRHGIGRIVAVRSRLLAEPAKLVRLDAVTAWPVRQVLDQNGAVCGLVVPRVPDSFFGDVRKRSGKTQTVPMQVQFLFIPPDRALRSGTPAPTPDERLTICRDFAATLAFLHNELKVAFGDISHANALFRLGANPTVMFVDCDAARVVGDVAVPQPYTPDWEPPEGGYPSSQTTDVYKLALFVLRCLTPGQGSSTNRDPAWAHGALDTRGRAMLAAALGGPPSQRPSAEEWHRYLRGILGDASGPPAVTGVHADRTIVAAGEPMRLSWSATYADTVELSGVGIATMSVPGAAGSGTVVLHPARTGTITVTARNALAEHSSQSEPVAVFEVPSFQDIAVPMPELAIPRITPLDLPPIGPVLPPFPASEPVPLPTFLATEPVPLPAFLATERAPLPAFLGGTWGDPDIRTPSAPADLAGPPPEFGFGPSTLPFDIADIITAAPDLETDQKVHP